METNSSDNSLDLDEFHHWARQLADDYLPDQWERVDSLPFARVAVNQERQLYYKVFLPRSPMDSLTALVRGSRATRARINGEALQLVGIDAPSHLLCGKLPGGREYHFTTLAPGHGIRTWLRTNPGENPAQQLQLRWELLIALGTFIGRLHACGFIHGDLKPDTVVAALHQDRFRFTLIDNEHNIRKNPPPGKMLLRNLIKLNTLPAAELSRTDRMRFFRAWRRQMRDVLHVEGKVLAAEAYKGAMREMADTAPF